MAKRNAQGAGSIRQRKDGTWEARYTVGRDPGTGKQKQKSIYGKTQKEVLQKLQQVQSNLNSGTHVEPLKLTVSAWLDIWLAEYMGGIKGAPRPAIKVQRTISSRTSAQFLQKLSPTKSEILQ